MARLSPKQQRFVDEYLIDLNASQAYIRAGYSRKHADVAGPRLLGNVGIAAAVRRAMEERSRRTHITADQVLRELALIALSDVRHYAVSDDGRLEIQQGAPSDDVGRAVSSVKLKRTRRVGKDGDESETIETEVKLWNKNQALQDLGKHLGLFTGPGSTDTEQSDGPPERFVVEDPGDA